MKLTSKIRFAAFAAVVMLLMLLRFIPRRRAKAAVCC